MWLKGKEQVSIKQVPRKNETTPPGSIVHTSPPYATLQPSLLSSAAIILLVLAEE